MRPPPARWFADTVSMRTKTGEGSFGPVFADAVDLAVNTSQGARLVQNSQGDLVASLDVVRFAPTDEAAVTIGSQVTFDGSVGTVTALRKFRAMGRLIYIEVTLT